MASDATASRDRASAATYFPRWYTVPLDLNAAKLLATDWLATLSG